MHRKILRTLYTALTLLVTATLFSCGDIATESSASAEKAYLLLTAQNAQARTIYPETVDLEDAALAFALTGTQDAGSERVEKSWQSYSAMTGDKTILLEPGAWTFTLTITKNGDEILASTVRTSIAAGANAIAFTSWQTASTGTGSVCVTLSFPPESKIATVQAGLFELDGTATQDFALESLAITDTTSETGTAQKSVTYQKTGVPVGYHRIRFLLYTEEDGALTAETAPVARDSDVILVSKNLTSSDTRTLTAFNTEYEIHYVTPAGMGMDYDISALSALLTTSFTENETVSLLKTSENRTFKANFFPAFYKEADYSGEKITGWNAKEVTGDQTLYVKWLTDATYLEGAIEEAAKNNYPVYVSGAITNDTITTIKNRIDALYAADDTSRTAIDLTDTTGLTELATIAFQECRGLTSVVIPDGVTSIGYAAFSRCSGLTSVTIPDGVTSIGVGAFSFCSGLTSVAIPAGVTSIGSGAFSFCSGLTSVAIPAGVTSIGSGAFSFCSGLTSVTIPESVTSIGEEAFYNCSNLVSLIVDSANSSYSSEAGILYNAEKTEVICCPAGKLGTVTIPSGVTSIGKAAFRNCSGLTLVTIPDGVTSIGEYAFQNCGGLTSLTIPSSVTSIGAGAFINCLGLTSVTIPAGVTSIGEEAFFGCTGLCTLTFQKSDGWYYKGTHERNPSPIKITDTGTLVAENFISDNGIYGHLYLFWVDE